MSYQMPQITEKGRLPRFVKKTKSKFIKKLRHPWMRQKMKKTDFAPQANRCDGGWYE